MFSPGAMIQHYKVLSLIGKGGMGEVYKCEDTMIGRLVAVKVLNPSLSTDECLVQRFKQEARIQAQLVHPNIVNLHTMMEYEGKLLIIMEYVAGNTLKELITRIGPIPEKRSLHILRQILEALSYAHGKNIIHRDIKPSNIILDEEDKVKILDFGIAKVMGEHGLTTTGTNIGTLLYMSPEQIQTPKSVDHRSDIFSLGITFFEMLSGKLPYNTETDSDFALQSQIVRNDLPDPREYYQFISPSTVEILRRMSAKDINQRYFDAVEVLHAISTGKTQIDEHIVARPYYSDHQTDEAPPIQDSSTHRSFWQQPWLLKLLRLYYIRSIIGVLYIVIMIILSFADIHIDTSEIRVLEEIMVFEYWFLFTHMAGFIGYIIYLARGESFGCGFFDTHLIVITIFAGLYYLTCCILNLQLLIMSFRIKLGMAANSIQIVRFKKKHVSWMITFAILIALFYLGNRIFTSQVMF